MKLIHFIRIYILLSILLITWLSYNLYVLSYSFKEYNNDLEKLKILIQEERVIVDSLISENSSKDINIGRYEIILDKIREKNPKLVDEASMNVE